MYQNLIKSLKTILSSKSTQAEKLLKISTLVDFADGLGGVAPKPTPIQQPTPTPPTPPTPLPNSAPRPSGAGPLVGVENLKK